MSPSEIPIIAIFTIGLEKPLPSASMRLAIKYSMFIDRVRKYKIGRIPICKLLRRFAACIAIAVMGIYPNPLFAQKATVLKLTDKLPDEIQVGAQQTENYFLLLKNKPIAVVAHPASLVNKTHLVDTLLKLGIQVKKIFAPEHGFR